MFEKKNIRNVPVLGIAAFLAVCMLLPNVPAVAADFTATTNWTNTDLYPAVTAQVDSDRAGTSAANLIDQSVGGAWSGGVLGSGWAMIDLGESRSVGGVSIAGVGDYGGRALRTYQIQYGNASADPTVDGDWTDVVSYDMSPYDQAHVNYAYGFDSVTAQKIRLKVEDAGYDYPAVAELQVWSGAAPTMESFNSGPAAASLLDGEKGGAAANPRDPNGRTWWMVDIGPDKAVDSVDMWFHPGYAEKDYVLQYGAANADPYYDVDWTDLANVIGNTDDAVSHSFALVGVQRIRLVSTANVVGDGYGRLAEIEINGPTGSCDTYLEADISGPDGVPDCYVDLYDLGKLGEQWLDCTTTGDPDCI